MWCAAPNEVFRAWSASVSLAQWKVPVTLQRQMIFLLTLHYDVVTLRQRSWICFRCSRCRWKSKQTASVHPAQCIQCLCAPLAAETYLTVYREETLKCVCTSFKMIDQSSSKKVRQKKKNLILIWSLLLFYLQHMYLEITGQYFLCSCQHIQFLAFNSQWWCFPLFLLWSNKKTVDEYCLPRKKNLLHLHHMSVINILSSGICII